MATLICRRLREGVNQATTFSARLRWSRKRTPNNYGKGYAFHPAKDPPPAEGSKDKRLGGPASNVFYNPSAYFGQKRHSKIMTEEYEDCPLDNDCTRSNARQVQNSYSITCSRSLSSTKNNILDLAFSRSDGVQPKMAEKPKADEDEQQLDLVENFSSKDGPRTFQQCRPEYKSLCYNSAVHHVSTSIQEGQDLLQKVIVLNSNLTPATISAILEKLSHLPAEEIDFIKTNTKFAMLCRYSVENIKTFSTQELMDMLGAFIRLRIPPDHSMLNAYQVEFSSRVWKMTTEELLLVADMWRYLGRSVPQFLEILYSCMNLRWKNLTLPQLIELIYIMGEGRRAPQELVQKLESMVLRYVDSINLEEFGAICLGFFKSNSGLSEYLMKKIGDRVSANMEEMSNSALVSVLKMFRYTHVGHLPFLKKLGEVAPLRIPSMGIQAVMHVSLTCTALHYLDESVMNATAAVVPDRIAYCRSKDLAKFLWSFGALYYEPPNAEHFYSTVIGAIRKLLREFGKFPEHFLTSLLGLAFVGRFPSDLIEFALSERFVELATKNCLFEIKKDLFTLGKTVEIECPDYKGNYLPQKLQQEVAEMLQSLASQDICLKPEVIEAAGLLESMLGGPQFVKNHMILPHTRSSDLEVHLDVSGKPIPINMHIPPPEKSEVKAFGLRITDDLLDQLLDSNKKANLIKDSSAKAVDVDHDEIPEDSAVHVPVDSKFSYGIPITKDLLSVLTTPKVLTEEPVIQPKLRPDVTKLAIQVSHRNHYSYTSKKHLLGLHSLKRRQLRHLGYTVVELPCWEWFPLTKRTKSEKLAYLHQKVFSRIYNDS
ncbi:FAST kinase domain-containing protein 5, mitochondrial [Pelodytes ibericus]